LVLSVLLAVGLVAVGAGEASALAGSDTYAEVGVEGFVSGPVTWSSDGHSVTYALTPSQTWFNYGFVRCFSTNVTAAQASAMVGGILTPSTVLSAPDNSPYRGSGTWSNTTDCGVGGYPKIDVLVNASGSPDGFAHLWYSKPAETPPSCSTAFSAVEASYVGTTLSARWKWSGTRPVHGWDLYVPGDGTAVGTGTAPGHASNVAVAVGLYGMDQTATLTGVTAGVTKFRVQAVDDPTCYATGTLSASAVGTPPQNTGTDNSGADCGLNPFCYVSAALRAAFVPSTDATASWSSRVDSIKTHPPVNFVLAGVGFVAQVVNDTGCNGSVSNAFVGGCSSAGASGSEMTTLGGGQSVDLLGAAGGLAGGGGAGAALGLIMRCLVWGVALLWMWRRVSRSFGGKS
jgi:hypothetical protein